MGTAGDDLHTTASQRLRGAGLRHTRARRALVDVLAAADRPLTIPEILREAASLAQASAYRNLNELMARGVTPRLDAGDGYSHFVVGQDRTEHHHRLVCTRCGRVADVTLDDQIEASLTRSLGRVAEGEGFEVEHHR